MVVVVTGAAGAGKSTVGRALADSLGWAFYDADDLHSPENIARMGRGEGLSDELRWPWLSKVRHLITTAIDAGEDAVVACSALKEAYRRYLADGLPPVVFVFLAADDGLLRSRLAQRAGHFAGPALLDSQLATMEPPRDAVTVDAALPVDTLVERIRATLRPDVSPGSWRR
jgi:gluconokinase